jgi:sugar/nucleoside kinase (ribokinase family)
MPTLARPHPHAHLQVLPLVDVYLPNDTEAMGFATSAAVASGATPPQTLDEAVTLLMKHIRCAVVVTKGVEGAMGRTAAGAGFAVPAVHTAVMVDTVGCGDAFDAGFLSQFVLYVFVQALRYNYQ